MRKYEKWTKGGLLFNLGYFFSCLPLLCLFFAVVVVNSSMAWDMVGSESGRERVKEAKK